MHQKHQARHPELLGVWQSAIVETTARKCPLEVNFTTDASETRYAFSANRLDDPISAPIRAKSVRAEENVILVIGMIEIWTWLSYP